MFLIFYAIIVYILASTPNALWIGKMFKGIDLRQKGSGNLGATNASRFLGAKLGLLVLVLDILKGFLPLVLIKPYLFANYSNYEIYLSIFSFIAVIGHSYSIYLKFSGGKSVAIMLGVYLALFPKILIFGLIVFLLVVYLTDYVALASIFMSISYILFVSLVYKNISYICLTILISLLIIFRHKQNIIRIYNKTEPKHIKTKKRN